MVARYDFIQIKAEVTPEGWIRDRPIVTRVGIFEYRNSNGTIKRELRPEAEVFKTDSIASLSGIPVTNGHMGMVTSKNSNAIIGTVLGPGEPEGTNLVANVIIHRADELQGRKELSLGYHADVDETPGEWNGHKYDAIQKNIKYNHLAIVHRGRSGNARLRLDSADGVNGNFDTGDDNMPDPVKLQTIRLDDIEYQASPEVIRYIAKANDKLGDMQKKYDSLEAERDTLKTKADKHEEELKKVRDDSATAIRARMTLEEIAKKFEVKFDAADNDRFIREKVVIKVRGEMDFTNRSDEYVLTAFDFAVADHDKKGDSVGNQRQQASGGNTIHQDSSAPEKHGGAAGARNRMVQRVYRPETKTAA
jgi:uncharacterized protein